MGRIVGELAAKQMQNIILINLRAEKDLLKQYGFADQWVFAQLNVIWEIK